MTSVIRSAKPSLSSRSRILSTTSRSAAEPLVMMLLLRMSVVNRNGTSELSAADAGGRFAAPTVVPAVAASAPNRFCKAVVN